MVAQSFSIARPELNMYGSYREVCVCVQGQVVAGNPGKREAVGCTFRVAGEGMLATVRIAPV